MNISLGSSYLHKTWYRTRIHDSVSKTVNKSNHRAVAHFTGHISTYTKILFCALVELPVLWGMTVTCCHHFLTFRSHLHPQQSCSYPCDAIKIALVLASKDHPKTFDFSATFYIEPHLEFLSSPGFATTYSLMKIFIFFWSASYPFNYSFQSPWKQLLLSPLSGILDLKALFLAFSSIYLHFLWMITIFYGIITIHMLMASKADLPP